MAFGHGRKAVFKLDNVAGTLTDVSVYVDSTNGLPGTVAADETTTYGKDTQTFIPGLAGGQAQIGGKWDPTLDAVFGAPTDWQSGTRSYEYGPEGASTGDVKFSGEAIITDYTVNAPVGGVVTWSATLQISDDVTRGTFA